MRKLGLQNAEREIKEQMVTREALSVTCSHSRMAGPAHASNVISRPADVRVKGKFLQHLVLGLIQRVQ